MTFPLKFIAALVALFITGTWLVPVFLVWACEQVTPASTEVRSFIVYLSWVFTCVAIWSLIMVRVEK